MPARAHFRGWASVVALLLSTMQMITTVTHAQPIDTPTSDDSAAIISVSRRGFGPRDPDFALAKQLAQLSATAYCNKPGDRQKNGCKVWWFVPCTRREGRAGNLNPWLSGHHI